MTKTVCTILLTLLTFQVFPQMDWNKGKIEQKHYLDTIPYQIQKGSIFIPVEINGKTYKFLFDTGSPLVIYDHHTEELDLERLDKVPIKDINDKSKKKQAVVLPKMGIGNITFLHSTGIILNKGESKVLDCLKMDGVLGSNLFRNSVVQIDTKNKHLIIADRKNKLSIKRKYSQKLTLDKQSTPIIKIKLQNKPKVTDEVVFDSGAETFYSMSKRSYRLFKDHNIKSIDSIAQAEGSSSIGFFGKKENQKNTLIDVKEISLNKEKFDNVISEVDPNSNSRIGYKLLNFGKVTIDYNKKRFYFKPYTDVAKNELSQKPWPIEPTLKNDKVVVGIIWDQNLTDKINRGDEILKFGNIDYPSLSICEAFLTSKAYNAKDQIKVKLKDVHSGKTKELKISRLR